MLKKNRIKQNIKNIKQISINKGNGVIHSNSTMWIVPIEDFDYANEIKLIITKYKSLLRDKIFKNKDKFHRDFILDFNIKKDVLKKNKRSFIMIDTFVRCIDIDNALSIVNSLMKENNEYLIELLEGCNFVIQKRDSYN